MNNKKEILQWHPAFFAGIQIELEKEADRLTFINEYQLGTKPKEIDVLIIKKDDNYTVQKNFGKFFRKYNIFEYKSPTDYLSIDDFYIGYAYACLYKVDTATIDSHKANEITLTFVTAKYPRKFIYHLIKARKYKLIPQGNGIYYISGDSLPIQLIVTSQLSDTENLWFCVLTNRLNNRTVTQKMLYEYEKHKDNALYTSIMDIVVRANQNAFRQEGNIMCEELEKIINEKLDAREALGKLSAKQETAHNLHKMGLPIEQIAQAVEEDIQTVRQWIVPQ